MPNGQDWVFKPLIASCRAKSLLRITVFIHIEIWTNYRNWKKQKPYLHSLQLKARETRKFSITWTLFWDIKLVTITEQRKSSGRSIVLFSKLEGNQPAFGYSVADFLDWNSSGEKIRRKFTAKLIFGFYVRLQKTKVRDIWKTINKLK